jgi:hypothetical protein
MLILPGAHAMLPDGNLMSVEVASKLLALVRAGATIVFTHMPDRTPGHAPTSNTKALKQLSDELFGGTFVRNRDNVMVKPVGKGRVIKGPYEAESFNSIGLEPDVLLTDSTGRSAEGVAWTHRKTDQQEIYFISNQWNKHRKVSVSLRTQGKQPVLYDPVFDETGSAADWKVDQGRTTLSVTLEANGSLFIILGPKRTDRESARTPLTSVVTLNDQWTVAFDAALGGVEVPVRFESLSDWSQHTDTKIKYYSGTAVYSRSFSWTDRQPGSRVWLALGRVENIAEVTVNNISCGVAWTAPYRVDITKALKAGENIVQVAVTNTWANRLLGDQSLPEEKRITKTNAPYRLAGKPLLPAGLLGPVRILTSANTP